jgi:hypothetical protein
MSYRRMWSQSTSDRRTIRESRLVVRRGRCTGRPAATRGVSHQHPADRDGWQARMLSDRGSGRDLQAASFPAVPLRH